MFVISGHMSTYLCRRNFTLEDFWEGQFGSWHVSEKHIWKMNLLFVLSYLCIWKFWKALYHFRNHLHYLDTYRSPCTLPLRELLFPWGDICKHSTVNDKVMGTRNITWMSDYPFTPVRIKYILFVYKNTHKMLDRNLGETHLFSQRICQTNGIWECTKHLQIVSNENYIDFSLCLYNYKL
jgi:hypothetical protein